MFGVLKEIKIGLDRPRSGWINRDIPQDLAETILQHSKKVSKAARIYGKHFPTIDLQKLVFMGKTHDYAEYKEKDYVPGEISQQEKFNREKIVITELRDLLGHGGQRLYDIWMEMEEGVSQESQIVKNLDKLDAAVQAIEYEKLGFHSVRSFYPYTLSKLSDPVLRSILEILLKKDYPEIYVYDQYFLLLECNGDENLFKEKIRELASR